MRALICILVGGLVATSCSRVDGTIATLSVNRSFNRALQFRLKETGPDITLRTIVSSGPDAYPKGKIVHDSIRTLTPDEAKAVRRGLQAVLASPPTNPSPGDGARDGSLWTLTGSGLFPQAMETWTPIFDAELRGTKPLWDFGLLLWRLANVDEPEKNLY